MNIDNVVKYENDNDNITIPKKLGKDMKLRLNNINSNKLD